MISAELRAEIAEHAREEAPNECCGLVAAQDGIAVGVHPASNAASSPLRFEIEPRELFKLLAEIEQESELGAIYHSHTRTAPEPSLTDVTYAKGWPGITWIIVGLAAGEPDVRAWRIDNGHVSEAELAVA